MDKRENYRYHSYHLTYEIDLLLELLDKEKPDVIVNNAAQGEGAVMYGSVEHAAKEDEPIKPTSPYAASKVAFDMYLQSVHRFLKFPMNVIRPSNAYCPGQLLHRVIPKAIVCGLTGRKLPLQGGGRAERSYIHARGLARAIHMVSEKAPLGTIYKCGADQHSARGRALRRGARHALRTTV